MSFYKTETGTNMGFVWENVMIMGTTVGNLYKSYRTMRKYLKGVLPGGTRIKPRAILDGRICK